MVYLGTISRWSKASSSISETLDEMKSALWSNKVTAWGKAHPDDNDAHQIAQAFWQTTDVNWDTNYAFSKSRSLGVYDVHLSRGEIEQVWPPKEPPAPASA